MIAPNSECDVCVLGEQGVGKTSFILHYIHSIFFEEVESSLEDIYQKQVSFNGISRIISILDTNSYVDAYSTSRKEQIRQASSLVFTYSVTDRDSFLKVLDNFERTLGVMKTLPPCALIGLKSDLTAERQVAYEEGEQLSQKMNALTFCESSAKLAVNVQEPLDQLVEMVLQNEKFQTSLKNTTETDLLKVSDSNSTAQTPPKKLNRQMQQQPEPEPKKPKETTKCCAIM